MQLCIRHISPLFRIEKVIYLIGMTREESQDLIVYVMSVENQWSLS